MSFTKNKNKFSTYLLTYLLTVALCSVTPGPLPNFSGFVVFVYQSVGVFIGNYRSIDLKITTGHKVTKATSPQIQSGGKCNLP